MLIKIATRVGLFVALFPVVVALWWFFGHVEQARADHERQVTLESVVASLVELHQRQATVREAEAAQIERLCRRGKLPANECPSAPPATDREPERKPL